MSDQQREQQAKYPLMYFIFSAGPVLLPRSALIPSFPFPYPAY